MAAVLVQFLTTHHYDQQISAKQLLGPPQKLYFSVAEFLVRQIDPSFAFSAKPEEEFLQVLHFLRYPYRVQASALKTVSVPQTYPQLLGILSWLAELATVCGCEWTPS